MALINITPIQDGTTAQASQVNTPLQTIVDEFNGNISSVNLANGAVTTNKIAEGAVAAGNLGENSVTQAAMGEEIVEGQNISPKFMQVGSVNISGGSGSATSSSVTFPTAFDATPRVFLMAASSAVGVINELTVSGATESGFTANILRDSATTTTVWWFAIEIPS